MSAKGLARAFGAVLADARRARGLSQEQLAEFAGFDRTYPSLVERGLREPGLSAFVRLSVAVGHPPTALLAATLSLAGGSSGERDPPVAGAVHRRPAARTASSSPADRPAAPVHWPEPTSLTAGGFSMESVPISGKAAAQPPRERE